MAGPMRDGGLSLVEVATVCGSAAASAKPTTAATNEAQLNGEGCIRFSCHLLHRWPHRCLSLPPGIAGNAVSPCRVLHGSGRALFRNVPRSMLQNDLIIGAQSLRHELIVNTFRTL